MWLAAPRQEQPAAWVYWLCAWGNLMLAGALAGASRSALSFDIALGLSSSFSWLVLAGAMRAVDQRVPAWLLPLALLFCGFRAVLYSVGNGSGSFIAPLAVEPFVAMAGAVVVFRSATATRLDRILLGPSCVLLAVVEGADALEDLVAGAANVQWGLWASAALVLLPTHIALTTRGLHQRAARFAGALHDRDELLRVIFASLRGTRIAALDPSGNMQAIFGDDPQAGDRYGVSGPSLVGASLSEILAPEARAPFRAALARAFEGEEAQSIEAPCLLPNGRFDWMLELAPVREVDGTVTSVLGVAQDVTELGHALRALRGSEARLNALLSSVSHNRVVIFDRDYRIESVVGNSSEWTLEPIPRDELEHQPLAKFMSGAGLERMQVGIRKVFESGHVASLHECLDMGHGPRHYDISLRPLRGDEGEVQGVISVTTDVTARVEEGEQRRRLEQRIAQSQQLESLGVLAGGIAHDFNNLLVGILGNAEIALETTSEDDPRYLPLSGILGASEHAKDLTNQLLAYAGKVNLSVSTVSVHRLVEEMAALLRGSIDPATHLDVRAEGSDVWVEGDATQLRQVVMNLLSNAAESLLDGRGEIVVRSGLEEGTPAGEEQRVYIEVRDDGCGMDDETRIRIFEPFFTTKFEGRGLGLAAVQGIIREHGGSMSVESTPEKGTTFRILLPRADAPSEERSAAVSELDEWSGRGRILVVDDEPAVRQVTSRMLDRLGFDIVLAEGRDQALSFYRDGTLEIDAVLLDLTMPDIDGYTLAGKLREVRPEVPLAFMSGHSRIEFSGSSDELFLEKPFRSAALRSTLKALLSARRVTQAGSPDDAEGSASELQ
jgi:signal transduction histidine kinase